jgi:diaminohydroxyphosphoribosylaminopyrimidine deaminase / 5-amino-6-(5-phosphoribosylamino)uracil reductase
MHLDFDRYKQALLPGDPAYMHHALCLAESARYRPSPNPRVGCLLVKNGLIIGEGATQLAGGDHAEVSAIKQAIAAGHSPHGATAYVTLEPCNHTGRTGPCSQALIAAGIQRAVVATLDPNPLTAGQGLAALHANGVSVKLLSSDTLDTESTQLVQQALNLNAGFFKRMRQGLPWIRLKTASSLDGYAALPNGQSQWLTGELARIDTHHWRASSCAVLTGIGTVLADNPSLTVRHVDTPRQPLRVVLDTHLRTPPTATLLHASSHHDAPADRPVLIIHACDDSVRQSALIAAGAELLKVSMTQGALDLNHVFAALGQRGLNEVHCEAGGRLNGALLSADLVDELMLYQAPLLLGSGLPWAHSTQHYKSLSDVLRWQLHSVIALGDDSRTVLRRRI